MTGILINVNYSMMGETSPAELGRALLWYVADRLGLDTWDEMTVDSKFLLVDGVLWDDLSHPDTPDMVALVEAANILINTKG